MSEVPCKTHPDAPHGFNRDKSHSLGRYVCDCEFWEPNVDENLSGLEVQEEAHFYLTIADFCNLVDKYGLDYLTSKSNDLRLQLIQWITQSEYYDEEIDWDECYVDYSEDDDIELKEEK